MWPILQSLSRRSPSIVAYHRRMSTYPQIDLSPKEQQLVTELDRFSGILQEEDPRKPRVELRIAGGWVRDKLIGVQSADLDVSISSMTGYRFAELFAKYLLEKHGDSLEGDPISRVTKIEANPDQSKHLETATARLYSDLNVDFVQLRSEEYGDDTRIPTNVRFGTPLEDAQRRDLTINALFYNIHTRQVEDWTEKGLVDLLDKPLVRTPLPPEQTFADDPLRILRCVRFASRFGFPVDEAICSAVSLPAIKEALSTKVSRERVGVELDKMLRGPDPLRALKFIGTLGLFSVVFDPSKAKGVQPDLLDPHDRGDMMLKSTNLMDQLLMGSIKGTSRFSEHLKVNETNDKKSQDRLKTIRKRLWLAAALWPWRAFTCLEGKKRVLLMNHIVAEAVKGSSEEKDFVGRLYEAADLVSNPALERFSEPSRRVALGLLLRNRCVHQADDHISAVENHWRTSIFFSLFADLLTQSSDNSQEIVSIYHALLDEIECLNLPQSAFEKTRLDGREIGSLLNIQGIDIKRALELIVSWQLENPNSDKAACSEWLLKQQSSGALPRPDPSVNTRPKAKRKKEG